MIDLLNKELSIKITHPFNSKIDGTIYELNYGTITYQNKLIGAYVLDETIPLSSNYTGYVIALIRHLDNNTFNIILAKDNSYSNKEILSKIYFKEKTTMIDVIRPSEFKSHFVHPFPFIYNNDCKILILGSFPSVKSREYNFYYMHPQNRFWKVLSNIYNLDFVSMNKDEKIKSLLNLHIALYDTITSCDIYNSSDTSISNATYINLQQLPNIKAIFCNGRKSYEEFIKHFPEYQTIAFKMPSTSPANAKCSLNELINEWKIIKDT